MQQFITKHQADVMGVLNGLDRIRFRGTQRWLATQGGLMSFLWSVQVKLTEFKTYAQKITRRLREHIEDLAEQSGRPSIYLYSSAESKEDLARQIAQDDGIHDGLIGVFRCVEPGYTFEVGPNAHGLIEKIPKTHRYILTPNGRTTITAFLVAFKSDTKQLNQLAA